jgi:hypothetical protein
MKIESITIIDKIRGEGVDLTLVNGKLRHVDKLEPRDWGGE